MHRVAGRTDMAAPAVISRGRRTFKSRGAERHQRPPAERHVRVLEPREPAAERRFIHMEQPGARGGGCGTARVKSVKSATYLLGFFARHFEAWLGTTRPALREPHAAAEGRRRPLPDGAAPGVPSAPLQVASRPPQPRRPLLRRSDAHARQKSLRADFAVPCVERSTHQEIRPTRLPS